MGKKKAPEPVRPIIVRRIIANSHEAHHGGAWKVAYADFVTAMMAFFLLMWLLGATDEKQRKGIADYFAPTIAQVKRDSAGRTKMFGGSSVTDQDKYPHKATQIGNQAVAITPKNTPLREKKKHMDRRRDCIRKTLSPQQFEKRDIQQQSKNPQTAQELS